VFLRLTVVITGCDGPEQFSRNLFENRLSITSPVDVFVYARHGRELMG